MRTRSRPVLATLTVSVALLLGGAACSDDSQTGGADTGARLLDGRGSSADSGGGSGDTGAGSADGASAGDGAAALPTTCDAACKKQTLEAVFGATREPIERAVYGVESGATTGVQIHIEALHGGGFTGCPQQSSPTPDRTLVISGVLWPPPAGGTRTLADGVAVSLLDFKGTLLEGPKPVDSASAATLRFVAADVCPSCLGKPAPSHPGGFVAIDVDATFAGGTVKGRLYAVHCDSLDK